MLLPNPYLLILLLFPSYFLVFSYLSFCSVSEMILSAQSLDVEGKLCLCRAAPLFMDTVVCASTLNKKGELYWKEGLVIILDKVK